MTLSPRDRELVESLPFDPNATVAFNEIAACLAWSDEIAEGLSPAGYEYVRDLLGARGYMHRGVPVEDWDYGSTDRIERWNEALGSGLRWKASSESSSARSSGRSWSGTSATSRSCDRARIGQRLEPAMLRVHQLDGLA